MMIFIISLTFVHMIRSCSVARPNVSIHRSAMDHYLALTSKARENITIA